MTSRHDPAGRNSLDRRQLTYEVFPTRSMLSAPIRIPKTMALDLMALDLMALAQRVSPGWMAAARTFANFYCLPAAQMEL